MKRAIPFAVLLLSLIVSGNRASWLWADDAATSRAVQPGRYSDSYGPLPAITDRSNVPGGTGIVQAPVPQRYAEDRIVPERGFVDFPPMAIEPHAGPLKPRQICEKDFYLNIVDISLHNRMIVKFTEESQVRWANGAAYSKSGASLAQVNSFLAKRPEVTMIRLSPKLPEDLLDYWEANGERNTGQDLANMNNYYMLEIANNPDPMALILDVLAIDIVETAYYEPKSEPACADIAPATPDWEANQDYEEAAPTGVDAVYSGSYWTNGRGNPSAWCIDVEWDWTEDHEDWPAGFSVLSGGDQGAAADHGDACSSIIGACDNGYGVSGISYGLTPKAVSWPIQGSWEAGFNTASGWLFSGESYFIEIHALGPTPNPDPPCACNCAQYHYIAVEYWQASFDAIQNHTANGRIVYEAAGNGGMDLDNAVYANRFQRWFRDSGAILCGAGVPGTRANECFSNYGSRLDLQGWGSAVYASGYGDLFNPTGNRNQKYTSSFGGTSSATPIVTGSGNCLQGISQGKYGITLTPANMRSYMSATGTAWTGTRDIGERPNLVNAINWIEPDVEPQWRGGWTYSVVPRNAAGATDANCPVTALLDGNLNTTYLNAAGYNTGYSPAPDAIGNEVYSRLYLDGDWIYWWSWGRINPWPSGEFWAINWGPVAVRGGRHSMQFYLDPLDVFNEYSEANNASTRQYVWSPLQLTNDVGIERGAPPLKAWGSPAYYNGDGFRATGGWWTACAVLPQSGDDHDLYSYADSYTSTTGFDASQYASAYGSSHADLVLVNGNVLGYGQSRLFQSIRYSDASTANSAIEGDAQTTIGSPYSTTRTIDANDIFDLYEFYADQGEQYYVGVSNVTGSLDLTLLVFTAGQNYYAYSDYAQRANANGANGNEYLVVTAPSAGWHCAVVIKESSNSYGVGGNYTFTFQKPLNVNLQAQNRAGWSAPIVARNSADATIASAVFPAAIQGNTTNYINATWYNEGGGLTVSSAFVNDWVLDGATAAGFVNGQTIVPLAYGERLNYNGGNIRGGRHTLTLNVDATNIVAESNEGDNGFTQQYVWSPLTLSRNVPLDRASPPLWGAGAYPNSDGFAYSIPQAFAGIAGLLSPTAGADYDLYQYTDYSGTSSGFSVSQGVSAYGSGVPDYVLVPWRIVGAGYTTYPAVVNFNSATQNVYVESDNSYGQAYNGIFSIPDPDSLMSGNIFRLYEVYLTAGTAYRFTCDVISGTADVEMRLHRDSTQVLYRGQTVAFANSAGSGGDEQIIYTPTVTDWYALVISKAVSASANLSAIYNLSGQLNVPAANPQRVDDLVIQWWNAPVGVRLGWNHVTQDSLGNPLHNRRYVVYRNPSPAIVPMDADSIGGTTDSTFIDSSPLGGINFYRVKVKSTP